MHRTVLTSALSLVISLPASAQQLTMTFNDGRVSLDATSVPVRTILVEWGKLGGTKVIGGERVSGGPLTLKLEDVPESQALEIVLRSVAGYMAAPRSASSAAGASIYDRILIMATSVVPPPAARPTPSQRPTPANQRFAPQRPAQSPTDDEEPDEEPDPNPPNPPVFAFPQPGQNNGFPLPGMFPNAPNGGADQPAIIVNPNSPGPQSITINPAQSPGGVPTFGSPTPGMINVAPTPQPVIVVRPPGI